MIQHRTFELLQNPKSIQPEDLSILEKDIAQHPYMQSIRAVYLYGNHQYNPEAYKELLSLTAAYTTDKKNLYQFIKQSADSEQQIANSSQQSAVSDEPKATIQQQSAISQEEKADNRQLKAESELPMVESELPKPSINFDNNSEDLLPKVKFQPTKSESVSLIPNPQSPKAQSSPQTQKSVNKHEEEMKRLIAEVEAKMAKNRAAKKKEIPQEEITSTDINFSEYEREEPVESPTEIIKEIPNEPSPKQETNHDWKPLNFEPNIPDALLKKEEPKTIHKQEVVNISEVKKEENLVEETPQNSPQSNIPKFINTWQSWLKLDFSAGNKHSEIPENEEKKEAVENTSIPDEPLPLATEKAKVIDTFIENNPKISKISKDFSDGYAPKDKGDDISHLMTETLANLYVEQRLYAKAIQSFKILIEKHPEKKEHFKARIQEVKELRANKNSNE